MKRIKYCLLMITFFVASSSHAADKQFHVGDISAKDLIAHYVAFSSSYDEFEVSSSDVSVLHEIADEITIVSLFGTWCHDSMREVPRMIKLLKAADNSNIVLALKTVGIDKKIQLNEKRTGEAYTQTHSKCRFQWELKTV